MKCMLVEQMVYRNKSRRTNLMRESIRFSVKFDFSMRNKILLYEIRFLIKSNISPA